MRKPALVVIAGMLWVISLSSLTAAQQMVFPGEDWERATPESQFIDSALLEEAVRYVEAHPTFPEVGVDEMAIIRNGRIVWEGEHIDRSHHFYSTGKSVTTLLLGLLIDDGMVELETLAKDYLPTLAEDYSDLTVAHLASMTSPYLSTGGPVAEEAGCKLLIPDEPLFDPPGSQFYYSNIPFELLANVMTRVAQQPIEDIFRERIAEPLEMGEWLWWKESLFCSEWKQDGIEVNTGSGGIEIAAENMARIGHLVLNDGQWDGEQLVSKEWLDEATTVQVSESLPVHPLTNIDGSGNGPGVYGYGWWTNGIRPEGNRLFPGAPPGTVAMIGLNNNMVFIIPEWEMVITRGGDEGAQSQADYPTVWGPFFSKVNEALIVLQAGDADQDFDFDQLDLVQVQIGGKYLTGQPATWGEGDWDGAPGGFPGTPPQGDGVFNQLDIVAAQQAAVYLTGPYAADAVVAVPEPNGLLLVGFGLIALTFRRYRVAMVPIRSSGTANGREK